MFDPLLRESCSNILTRRCDLMSLDAWSPHSMSPSQARHDLLRLHHAKSLALCGALLMVAGAGCANDPYSPVFESPVESYRFTGVKVVENGIINHKTTRFDAVCVLRRDGIRHCSDAILFYDEGMDTRCNPICSKHHPGREGAILGRPETGKRCQELGWQSVNTNGFFVVGFSGLDDLAEGDMIEVYVFLSKGPQVLMTTERFCAYESEFDVYVVNGLKEVLLCSGGDSVKCAVSSEALQLIQ